MDHLLERAKSGDGAALGALLENHRAYLRLLARQEIGHRLQGKVGASDIVQEVFLKAHRQFDQFQGASLPQFESWLQTILAGTLANTIRHYFGTQARNLQLEQDLLHRFDQSAIGLSRLVASPQSSPSQHVADLELRRLVAEAILGLPDDYQEVLTLRHLEGLTFPEVAARMERTLDSVEKLWLRAITKLRKQFVQQRP